jgi:putative peptidoglycan lipid II flippase
LPSGGIASLNYAYNLFLFPIAIFSFAITTAIFPRISDAFVRKADTELTKVISESISASLVVFTPITFLFIFHTEPIIKVIFERGNFSPEGTTMTAEVLQFYGLSLIFYAVYTIMNKILYSTELVKQLLFMTIFGIIIKLAFNFILVGSMKQSGLALGTSLSYLSFLFFSFILINKKLKFSYFKIFFTELTLNLFNAFISFIIASMLINIFAKNFLLDEILFMLIFVGIFFLNLTIQKHPTVATLINIFRRFKLYF